MERRLIQQDTSEEDDFSIKRGRKGGKRKGKSREGRVQNRERRE